MPNTQLRICIGSNFRTLKRFPKKMNYKITRKVKKNIKIPCQVRVVRSLLFINVPEFDLNLTRQFLMSGNRGFDRKRRN